MTKILLALALGLVACSDGGTSVVQSELDSAREQWGDGLGDYSFVWQRSCECTEDTTRPILITVEDDVIAGAVYADEEGGVVPADVAQFLTTVDGVFDRIQEAIDDDAFRITVEYASNGAPTSVAIDYDERIADEEFSLQISELSAP
jgi:hypothetical protein